MHTRDSWSLTPTKAWLAPPTQAPTAWVGAANKALIGDQLLIDVRIQPGLKRREMCISEAVNEFLKRMLLSDMPSLSRSGWWIVNKLVRLCFPEQDQARFEEFPAAIQSQSNTVDIGRTTTASVSTYWRRRYVVLVMATTRSFVRRRFRRLRTRRHSAYYRLPYN